MDQVSISLNTCISSLKPRLFGTEILLKSMCATGVVIHVVCAEVNEGVKLGLHCRTEEPFVRCLAGSCSVVFVLNLGDLLDSSVPSLEHRNRTRFSLLNFCFQQ